MILTQRDSAQGGVLNRDNLAEQDFVASATRFLARLAATAGSERGFEIDRGQRVSARPRDFEGPHSHLTASFKRIDHKDGRKKVQVEDHYLESKTKKKKAQCLSAFSSGFGASRTTSDSTRKQMETVPAFMGSLGFKRS